MGSWKAPKGAWVEKLISCCDSSSQEPGTDEQQGAQATGEGGP